MANEYSIKINRQEGALEITGDKDWVSSKLEELKELYAEYTPAPVKVDGSTKTGKVPRPKKSKKQTKKQLSSKRPQKNTELEAKLTKEVKGKLASFVEERQASYDRSQPSQAAIIARFLQKELRSEGVDQNDTYTVYTTMGWKMPRNLTSQLNNAMSRNKYFSGISKGKYVLSVAGENFADHDSVQKTETVKPSK